MTLPPFASMPFAAGKSPFLIKGNNYRGSFIQYDQLVPGGHKAVIAKIEDANLRGYLSQDFFSSSWYDIYPMVWMDECAAGLCGKTFDEFIRATCEIQAGLDMNGIYRMVLKFVSPETCIKRMAGFSKQYFSFADHSINLSKGSARFVTTGVPVHFSEWFIKAMAYYLGYVSRHSGAREPSFVFHPIQPSGTAHGVQVAILRWEMHWKS